MKKITFRAFAALFLGTMLLTSCASLKKMKKNADKISYNITPEVLEAHGGEVDLAIQGHIPEKFFVKKATVVATPVLVYDGGEKAYTPYTLQGESVEANNKVISYLDGGSFSYKGVIPFADAMRDADLEVRITASKGTQSLDFDPIKVADGVIATSTLAENSPISIVGIQKEKNTTGVYNPAVDPFQRIVPDEYMADLMYLINSSYVRGQEMKKEDLAKLNAYIKDAFVAERKELKGVEVSAYASPDGEEDWNTTLSQRREGSASKVVNRNLKKNKVEAELTSKYTPEDWEGFKELMEKSNIQDKELILRVLSMYSDPEVREREIRNLSSAFTDVADHILPKLRRAKITASVDLIGKTDEEIAALADSDPSKLNQAELLYAAGLTDDLNKQKAIYTSFTRIYSDDWRGFNNLGMVLVLQDKVSDASTNFEKADKLDSNNPVVQNNLGVVALKNNDVAKAEELFGAASGAGKAVSYNLGLVNVMKGDYAAAVKNFGDCSCVNNALAQMLNGDNNAALRTLNSASEETALVAYLKAVVGARTAKTSLMYSSLETAVRKDSRYKGIAKTDLEFAKYAEESKFKSIVD
jgi:tetratricopeptide (TPR) repeat protein